MKTIPAQPVRVLTPTAVDASTLIPRTTVVAAPPLEVYGLPAPIFMQPRPTAKQPAVRVAAPTPAARRVRRSGLWARRVMWLAVVVLGAGSAGTVLAFSDVSTQPEGSDAPMIALAPPTEIAPDLLPSGHVPASVPSSVAAATPPPRVAQSTPSVAIPPAPSTTPPAPNNTPPAPSSSPPVQTTPAPPAPSTSEPSYPGDLVLPPAAERRAPDIHLPGPPKATEPRPTPVHWKPSERTPVRPKSPMRVPVLVGRTR